MSIAHRLIGHAVLVISLLVGASAAVLGFASVGGDKPAWALFGFEVVTIIAAVLGILFGLGKFRQSPGMALACIAGTFFVAGVLGWMSVTASAGQTREVGGIPLNPVAAFRVLAALVVAGGSAYFVLSRRAGAWRPAIIGAALGAPVAAVAVLFLYGGTRPMVKETLGTPAGALIGFIVIAGLLSAAVHLVIRGFEIGSAEDAEASPAGAAGATSKKA